jgi:hypothetical protein
MSPHWPGQLQASSRDRLVASLLLAWLQSHLERRCDRWAPALPFNTGASSWELTEILLGLEGSGSAIVKLTESAGAAMVARTHAWRDDA